jgi:hypothetical protein
VAVDKVGNHSDDRKNPTKEIVIPLQRVVYLENKTLEGSLKPATYIVGNNVAIARGKSLYIKYSKLVFLKPLTVKGTLIAEKTIFSGNPNDVIFSQQTYPRSDCLYIKGNGKLSLRNSKLQECNIALYIFQGYASVYQTTFNDNFLNVISYEPKKVTLEKVSFDSDEIINFKLRGKLTLKSIVYNGIERKIKLSKVYKEFQNWVLSYITMEDMENLKEIYEAFVPLLNSPKYLYEDKKLVELCKTLNDKLCLKYFLPALIKLHPGEESFVLDYLSLLDKEEACRFLQRYTLTHRVSQQIKDIARNVLRCGGF